MSSWKAVRSFTGGLGRGDLVGRPYFELVVVGTSLGGLHALEVLLSGLPNSFPLSIAVVQHRYKDSNLSLSFFLQPHCALPLKEAEDKEVIVPGRVYFAPADYHLLVEPGRLALSTEAPVLYARPSIDVLFESAADAYAKRVIGVIMTGASHDGAAGLASIKAGGGLTVVQEPTTAQSRIMPEAAIAAVAVDAILLLEDIAPFLVKVCNG
jgi:two-component system chemotaxis response regulator CheB